MREKKQQVDEELEMAFSVLIDEINTGRKNVPIVFDLIGNEAYVEDPDADSADVWQFASDEEEEE
jgi:hypothetical protein